VILGCLESSGGTFSSLDFPGCPVFSYYAVVFGNGGSTFLGKLRKTLVDILWAGGRVVTLCFWHTALEVTTLLFFQQALVEILWAGSSAVTLCFWQTAMGVTALLCFQQTFLSTFASISCGGTDLHNYVRISCWYPNMRGRKGDDDHTLALVGTQWRCSLFAGLLLITLAQKPMTFISLTYTLSPFPFEPSPRLQVRMGWEQACTCL